MNYKEAWNKLHNSVAFAYFLSNSGIKRSNPAPSAVDTLKTIMDTMCEYEAEIEEEAVEDKKD